MKRRGRPTLSEGRTERVAVRMSAEQRKLIDELAQKREETLTEIIFAGLALLLLHQALKK
jgi:uncharacterized protein (DUF1778 family)